MRPRLVLEPITGLRWIARSRGDAALAWLPVLSVLAGIALGATGYAFWSYIA